MKWVVILLTFCILAQANAATINVADYGDGDCTQTNAASAVAAASDGDTVVFPLSCAATWTTELEVAKAININGNGTTLTAGASFSGGGLIVYRSINSATQINIYGLTIDADATAKYGLGVSNSNTLINLRVRNNSFQGGFKTTAIVWNYPYGVIDSNSFTDGYKEISYSAGTDARADASWASLTAGDSDCIFIENNTFVQTNAQSSTNERISTYHGGKMVVRYNTFSALARTSAETLPFMNHGNAIYPGYYGNSGYRRSQSVIEIYNNTVNVYKLPGRGPFHVRGGSVLIYNNKISATVNAAYVASLAEEEWYAITQFTPQRQSWPSEDQVHNSFIWGNTLNGVASSSVTIQPNNGSCTDDNLAGSTQQLCCSGLDTGNCNTAIVLNQDYYLHAPCASTDETDAYGNTCTHGIEAFTDRPGASDTDPSDGDPYTATGTMTFTASVDNKYYPYTAYTYPHPWRVSDYTVTVTNTGSGHSPSHDGARTVQTGGSLVFTSGVYNGWKVVIGGTCGCTTDGCTVTPTENCTITCASSEIQLMPW